METTNDIEKRNENVSILLKQSSFAEFVLNFLGKKEKLRVQKELRFCINHNDIEQFYYLINNKIEKEQYVLIEHFRINISYNDSTQREISGIESLNKFLETRHVYPESITLTWNIIFQFPSAPTIENQEIELTFITENKKDATYKDGRVILTINHTNQAWGIEILNLIKEKIEEVSLAETRACKVAKFLLKNIFNKEMAPALFMFLFSLSLAFKPDFLIDRQKEPSHYYDLAAVLDASNNSKDTLVAMIAINNMDGDFVNKTSESLVEDIKIKKVLNTIGDDYRKAESRKIIMPLSFLGFFIGLGLIWYYLTRLVRYFSSSSFILITKRAEKMKEDEEKGRGKVEFYSLSFILMSLILAFIGNYITRLIIG